MRQGECEGESAGGGGGGRGDGEGEREGLRKRVVGIGRDSNLAFYAQLTYTDISGWKGREV